MTTSSLLSSLIGGAGSLTSEFAGLKTATTWGKILGVIGILITVGGYISSFLNASNPNSHAAMIAGTILAVLSAIATPLASIHYTSGRANLKANAQSILQAAINAGQSLETLLATTTPTPAAPAAPVVSAK